MTVEPKPSAFERFKRNLSANKTPAAIGVGSVVVAFVLGRGFGLDNLYPTWSVADIVGNIMILILVALLTSYLAYQWETPSPYKDVVDDLHQRRITKGIAWDKVRSPMRLLIDHSNKPDMMWDDLAASLTHLLIHRGAVPPALVGTISSAIQKISPDKRDLYVRRVETWRGIVEHLSAHDFDDNLFDDIAEVLKKLHSLPAQVERIFISGLQTEVDFMNLLVGGKPITGTDRRRQFDYAGGVAQWYAGRDDDDFTVWATALDRPSVFYKDFHDYFARQQEALADFDDTPFQLFTRAERQNVRAFIDGRKTGPVMTNPPAKARIVVIELDALTTELADPAFWEFVFWHPQTHFGLKFLVLGTSDPEGLKDRSVYVKRLGQFTAKDPDQPIADFIVYGNECVFGRVDTSGKGDRTDDPTRNPKHADGEVTIRLLHLSDEQKQRSADSALSVSDLKTVINGYRAYFRLLWTSQATVTLTGLFDLLGLTHADTAELRQRLTEFNRLATHVLEHSDRISANRTLYGS